MDPVIIALLSKLALITGDMAKRGLKHRNQPGPKS